MSWRTLNGIFLKDSLKDAVEQAIIDEMNSGNKVRICIGTDSQVKGCIIEFATVIVFIRLKNGGFMFLHKEQVSGKMAIRDRMMAEVTRSIETTYQLQEVFDKYGIQPEVHADINTSPSYKSHQALQDAMGYILGMGYAFRAKPHAFASTSCANKVL